jgi:hypothetical protein
MSHVRHLLVTESPQRGRRTLEHSWETGWTITISTTAGHELSLRMAGSSLAERDLVWNFKTMVCPALESRCRNSLKNGVTSTSPLLRSCMSGG